VSVIVRMHHIRERGKLWYCVPGARAFFERHGLDWRAFIREGIPAEQLERTGDAMALKAVARARAEHEGR